MDRKEDAPVSLVRRAIRGDDGAFGELMEHYKVYLYKVAYCHCKNQENALDAVQECVTAAYLHIRKVHSPQYFRTWLTRILINVIQKEQKKAALRAEVPYEENWETKDQEGMMPEERMDLYHAIDELPQKYRSIIILKYFNDFKISEISQVMEMPEGTVKSFLNRARKMLREKLEGGSGYESESI